MITAFVKAYWKQLLIVSMLAALVAGGVVAWNIHGDRQYDAGYAQAKADRKAEMIKPVNMTNRRKQPMNVKRSRGSTRRAMMLLMLPLALAGCSSSSLPSVSSSGSITPLSALGRQPQTPEFCLPTCSKNLSNETGNWQNTLTGQLKPEGSAKDSTMN